MEPDQELTERRNTRKEMKAAEDAAGLSIADRLTHRTESRVVVVALPDDEYGEISIEMQIPSWGQTCELTQMESLMATPEGHKRIAEIMNDLCRTPGLDLEFWSSGVTSLLDMRLLLEGLTIEATKTAQHREDIRSFRKD